MKTTDTHRGDHLSADNGELLPCVEVSNASAPDFSVIWLHGLGADGHDFEPVVPMLELPSSLKVRFIFPHAPVRPVTLNGGMPMRAWYDIKAISADRDQDEEGIAESQRAIEALMARERSRGIPAARQVVAGFSQGGAMAIHVALRHPERLAGLMALSCYLLLPGRLDEAMQACNAQLPVFMAHGEHDPVVAYDYGRQSADFLNQRGLPLDWHRYPIPHSVSPEELTDIGRWLAERFA